MTLTPGQDTGCFELPDVDAATITAIAALNDDLRRNPHGAGKKLLVTATVAQEGPGFHRAALRAVAAFSDFNDGNDPHGEHDFGEVEVNGKKLWFKIDYYDSDGQCASEDPTDPAQTLRVMTLLFPEDY